MLICFCFCFCPVLLPRPLHVDVLFGQVSSVSTAFCTAFFNYTCFCSSIVLLYIVELSIPKFPMLFQPDQKRLYIATMQLPASGPKTACHAKRSAPAHLAREQWCHVMVQLCRLPRTSLVSYPNRLTMYDGLGNNWAKLEGVEAASPSSTSRGAY